jgi:DNA polymerase elongation subunit (family B)
VAKKKMARGEIVNSNDRIEIVILQDPPGSKATPEWSRAEDLAYAVANRKQIDMIHYILTYETPITNLLASMVPVNVVEYIFKRAVDEAKRVGQKNGDIRSFFGAKRKVEDAEL